MIRQILFVTLAGVFMLSLSADSACKVKSIVKKHMPLLAPYEYDAYAIKEIIYGPKPKKETIDFEVFSDEEYKLVFCQTELPQEVSITIYEMKKGKKEIIYFDESGKKSLQTFSFGPTRSGTYYIEYEIPAATAPGQKGCFAVLIGVK